MEDPVAVALLLQDAASGPVHLKAPEVAVRSGRVSDQLHGRVPCAGHRAERPRHLGGHASRGERHPGDVGEDRFGLASFAPEVEQQHLTGDDRAAPF